MKDFLIKVGRWLAVPVCAVIGAVVMYAISFGLTYIVGCPPYFEPGESSLVKIILNYAMFVGAGYGFIKCGVAVAPSHKGVVKIVLAVLASLIAVALAGFTFLLGFGFFVWTQPIAMAVTAWTIKAKDCEPYSL